MSSEKPKTVPRLLLKGPAASSIGIDDYVMPGRRREEEIVQAFVHNDRELKHMACISCANCPRKQVINSQYRDEPGMRTIAQTQWRCGMGKTTNYEYEKCPDGYNVHTAAWDLRGEEFNEHIHNHDVPLERQVRIRKLKEEARPTGIYPEPDGSTTIVTSYGALTSEMNIKGDQITVKGNDGISRVAIGTIDSKLFHPNGMAKDGYEQLMEEASERDKPQTDNAGTW